MSDTRFKLNDRAKIGYVDVVLVFATFVMFATTAGFIFRVISMIRSYADPLTAVLVGLLVPMLVIGILYSMGVSARS